MPFIAQVAIGHKPVLTIYGGDYNTADGTGKYYLTKKKRNKHKTLLGIRDYIHVMDLATGHVAALDMLCRKHQRLKASVAGRSFTLYPLSFRINSKKTVTFTKKSQVYNLGTGQGISVLQLVKTFERVTGSAVPYKIVERRKGDISMMYANADLAEKELGWKAKHSLEEMCKCAKLFCCVQDRINFFCFRCWFLAMANHESKWLSHQEGHQDNKWALI